MAYNEQNVQDATAAFRAAYAANFPPNGDASDHDEATRCGVEAVLRHTEKGDHFMIVTPAEVRKGDTFTNADGDPVWIALEDAVKHARVFQVPVKYVPDGGRGWREWPLDTNAQLTIVRPGA